MKRTLYLFAIFFIAGTKCAEDDSFAGGFLSGLLDSLTTTADAKDCPGICVHSLATIICYEVLEDIQCPSANMKCCVESNNTTLANAPPTTQKPVKVTNTPMPVTKPPHKVEKPIQSESSKTKDNPCSELRNGVCVAEHLAEYCEAYFTTGGLCKSGSKCCVHPDNHMDKMPSDLYIPNSQKNQTMYPSKPTKPNVPPSSHRPKPQPIKMHSSRPTKPQEPLRESVEYNQIGRPRPCDGECVSGLFALLCDDVDTNAYCENEGSCCVTSDSVQPTSPRPTQPPKCPGPCMLNILQGLCTGVLVPNTANCKDGQICCDTSRAPPTSRPKPTQRPTTTTRRPFLPTTTQAPDYREDCPGTCIMSFISFTCFRNAEMTDLFKCKKEGTECCAPKSKILEYQGLIQRNDSYPVFVNSQTQQHLPQYLPNYPPPNQYQPIAPNMYAPAPVPVPVPNPYQQYQPQPAIPNNYAAPPANNYIQQPQPIPPQQSIAASNYAPAVVPPQNYGPIPQSAQYSPNVVPNQPHLNLSPAYSTPIPTPPPTLPPTTTTTTTSKAPAYSKYVCGVKGTTRNGRKLFLQRIKPRNGEEQSAHRAKRQVQTKSKEVLILGSELIPIQIHNDKLGEFAKQHHDAIDNLAESKAMAYANVPKIIYNQNYSSYNRQARVVGGEDGENGEWCWQVALINSLNQYLCSAALIGTQWVLTAAHCVTNIVRSGDAIYVRVGDYDLTRKLGSPGAQTLRVATTYIHHNHNSQTLDNDIALLKLNGQAELLEGVCLVCLPARGVNHAAGKRCTVTGYGYITQEGPIPLRVREAELPIVSDAECIRKVNAVTDKLFILPASSFCAGGEPGNDACQGDGGGPLVCEDDGFYELAGIVSWGFGCGKEDVPGVYVKVSSFIGWINQIISVNNL